jgi:hypothetical protein
MLKTPDALRAVGNRITYRQLDYWIRTGAITIGDGRRPGSGNRRTFTPAEIRALVEFVNAYEMHSDMTRLFADGSVWESCMERQRLHVIPGGTS